MKRICAQSGQEFEITEVDLAFLKKRTPKIGEKVYKLPLPTLAMAR